MPPKEIEGRKPQILAILGLKIDPLSPPFHNARKIGKSKNNKVNLWLWQDVHTKHGGGPPTHL